MTQVEGSTIVISLDHLVTNLIWLKVISMNVEPKLQTVASWVFCNSVFDLMDWTNPGDESHRPLTRTQLKLGQSPIWSLWNSLTQIDSTRALPVSQASGCQVIVPVPTWV